MGWLPEEGHDGCEVRCEGEECMEGLVSEDSKGVFDVCGNEDVTPASTGQGTKIVDHLVSTGGEKSAVSKGTNGAYDVWFRNIQS